MANHTEPSLPKEASPRKQHLRDNKVLGYHRFLQILLHSEKRWVKVSANPSIWNIGKTHIQIMNIRIGYAKKKRRKILSRCLTPNLTVMERIDIQNKIELLTSKIHHLKEVREEMRLPRMRGEREQGVIRI